MINFNLMTAKTATHLPAWNVLARGGIVFSTLGVIVYTAWVLGGHFDPAIEPIVSSLGLIFLHFLTSTFSLSLAFNPNYSSRLQRGWLLIGLAVFCNGMGETLWFYFESIMHVDPFPSLADLFFLLYYPLLLGGLLHFPFAPATRQERRTLGLDLAIVMTTCFMTYWYFILAPQSLPGAQGLKGIVGMAYPIGDLLLLAGVMALIQRDVQRVARGTLFFLGCSMIFAVVVNSLFAYLDIHGISYAEIFLNILWLLAALCSLSAIIWQILSVQQVTATTISRFERSRNLLRLALPYLAVVVGLGLLVYVVNSNQLWEGQPRGVLLAALLLVGLVMLRQYLILRDNVALYEEMKQLASTDSLTGLYNRHFFNEIFPIELQRAGRYEKSLSILLVDIDGFKKINDTLGHLKGDDVLRIVAQSLAGQLRSMDLIARFGGDEFVVILPETAQNGSRVVAERLKKAVARHQIAGVQLGVSIGESFFRPGASPEQLLEDADRDLYLQKDGHNSPLMGDSSIGDSRGV
jgi:diguanylate cyclase (GGDEF)-like protein